MTLKLLLDENVYLVYKTQFIQRNSELIMCAIGVPGTPSKSTLDPEILCGLYWYCCATVAASLGVEEIFGDRLLPVEVTFLKFLDAI